MKVRIHQKAEKHGSHKHYSTKTDVVEAEVKKENKKTILVTLPDGNVIKRHKSKHVVLGDAPIV